MPMLSADTYVVRIYRRVAGDPPQLIGVVEPIPGNRRMTFHTSDELWKILASKRIRRSALADRIVVGKGGRNV
jgi:hypothetical protein